MCPVMEQLTKIVSEINGFLWGMYCLIPLLCGVGIYFTLKLDFIQIRRNQQHGAPPVPGIDQLLVDVI